MINKVLFIRNVAKIVMKINEKFNPVMIEKRITVGETFVKFRQLFFKFFKRL